MLQMPDEQQLRKMDDLMDETTRRTFREMLGLRPPQPLPPDVLAAWHRYKTLYERIDAAGQFPLGVLALIVTITGVEDQGEIREEGHAAVVGETPEISDDQRAEMVRLNELTRQWDGVTVGTAVKVRVQMQERLCKFQGLSMDTGFVTISLPSGTIMDVPFADATLPNSEGAPKEDGDSKTPDDGGGSTQKAEDD